MGCLNIMDMAERKRDGVSRLHGIFGLSPRSCDLKHSRVCRVTPLPVWDVSASDKVHRYGECGWYRGRNPFVPIRDEGFIFLHEIKLWKEKHK